MNAATAEEALDLTFAALADPTRRAILSLLRKGETAVNDLVSPFHISQPAISKHLKVLERARLISRGKDGQFRPCKLNATPMKSAVAYLMSYEQFWQETFDNLDAYAQQMMASERKTRVRFRARSKTKILRTNSRKK